MTILSFLHIPYSQPPRLSKLFEAISQSAISSYTVFSLILHYLGGRRAPRIVGVNRRGVYAQLNKRARAEASACIPWQSARSTKDNIPLIDPEYIENSEEPIYIIQDVGRHQHAVLSSDHFVHSVKKFPHFFIRRKLHFLRIIHPLASPIRQNRAKLGLCIKYLCIK
jgi:hypothetical protein